MYVEIEPYNTKSKWYAAVSALATAICVFLLLKHNDGVFFVIPVILFCWVVPLVTYIRSTLHSDRSVTVSKSEIKCLNSAKKHNGLLAVGGYESRLSINRADIVSIDMTTFDCLKITTKDDSSYIIDSRAVDAEAVKIALDGRYDEAKALVQRKETKMRRIFFFFNVVFNAVMCFICFLFYRFMAG